MSKRPFDLDWLCEQAIETGRAFGVDLSILDGFISLKLLDYVIERVRSMKSKGLIQEDAAHNVATCLGAYLGEIMLRDKLEDKGFSWQLYETGLPVLMDSDRENMASPISRVQKIILEDDAGSVIAYYKAFLFLLENP